MAVLSMVSENHFYIALVSLRRPVKKIHSQPKVNLSKKMNKSVLSHIGLYIEHDEYKPVVFFNETISFTCQNFKKQ